MSIAELITNIRFNTTLDPNQNAMNFLNYREPSIATQDAFLQTSMINNQPINSSSFYQTSIQTPELKPYTIGKENELTKDQVTKLNDYATLMMQQRQDNEQLLSHKKTQAQIIEALEAQQNTLKINYDVQVQQLNAQIDHEREKSKNYFSEIQLLKHQMDEFKQQILRLQQDKLSAELTSQQNNALIEAQRKEIQEYKILIKQVNINTSQLTEENLNYKGNVVNSEKTVKKLIDILQENGVISSFNGSKSVVFQPQNDQSKHMVRKCTACGEGECQHGMKTVPSQKDRAQKVIDQLNKEKQNITEDLTEILQEAYHNPEQLNKNIDKVKTLIKQQKSKDQCVKELKGYKKQVKKLGVNIK